MLLDVNLARASAIGTLERVVKIAEVFERIILPDERIEQHLLREFAEHAFFSPRSVHRLQVVDEAVRNVAQ